jgi:hypothetical protein
LSLVLDANRLQTADASDFPHQRSAFELSLAMPALGLSYYATTVTRVTDETPTAEPVAVRNTDGFVRVERLVARQAGVTFVQSVARGLAIGVTGRLVRGSTASGLIPARDSGAFEDAASVFPRTGTTKFDADVGIMAAGAFAKAGLSARNLFEPAFGTAGGPPIRLERRVRGGVSLLLLQAVTVAADIDFTKTTTSRGRWRDAAIGAEGRPARRAWVRSGVHWNTAANAGAGAAPVFSLGGSYAVYGSILADGQISVGSAHGDRGWGLGLRFVY